MTANELRIGNYLHNGTVSSITRTCIWNHCEELYLYNELEPIKLDELFLLNLGFIKNEQHEHPNFDEFIIEDNFLFGIGNYNGEYWLIEHLESTFMGSPEIKYVHELQNIYHSLTGNELTIKL